MPFSNRERLMVRIEPLPDKTQETVAKVGESILSIVRGETAIKSLQRDMAPARRILDAFRFPSGEPIEASNGKLFVLVFDRPVPITMFRSRNVGNGCGSGVVSDFTVLSPKTQKSRPAIFLAKNFVPYAHNDHGTLSSGYEFRAPGNDNPGFYIDPSEQGTISDGIYVGQTDYWQALDLLKTTEVVGYNETEVARLAQEISDLIAKQDAQLSLAFELEGVGEKFAAIIDRSA